MEIPLKVDLFPETLMQVDMLITRATLQHREKAIVGLFRYFFFLFFYSGVLKKLFPFDTKKNFLSINSQYFHRDAREKNDGMGL